MAPTHFGSLCMLIVQGVLSGLYTASFFHCFRWLVFSDEGWECRKQINWTMLAIAILIFVLAMTNFGIIVNSELSLLPGPPATVKLHLAPAQPLVIVRVYALVIFECNYESFLIDSGSTTLLQH